MLNELFLLDIESVPQHEAFESLDPHWRDLFSDKQSKTMPEETDMAEIYLKKAGILAEFGRIVCISTAVFQQTPEGNYSLKMKSLCGHDEVEILRSFTGLCERMEKHCPRFQFAGHNIREFDIPFICRRLVIHGIPLPPSLQLHNRKPWEVRMFDTMAWWKFGDYKNYVSLKLLAQVLGIPDSKDDMDGSMVKDVYYRDKDLARIQRYCEKDVEVTARIILRFLNGGVGS